MNYGGRISKAGVLLAGVLLLAGSLFTGGSSVASASSNGQPSLKSLKGQTLVVTTWGGVWTQAEQKDLWGPFTKATGIKVQAVVNGSDPAIPAMLGEQTNNVTVDLVEPLNPAVMINIVVTSNLQEGPEAERIHQELHRCRRDGDGHCVQPGRHEKVPVDAS
jgi:spermidine/putrescine-binding protein